MQYAVNLLYKLRFLLYLDCMQKKKKEPSSHYLIIQVFAEIGFFYSHNQHFQAVRLLYNMNHILDLTSVIFLILITMGGME